MPCPSGLRPHLARIAGEHVAEGGPEGAPRHFTPVVGVGNGHICWRALKKGPLCYESLWQRVQARSRAAAGSYEAHQRGEQQ